MRQGLAISRDPQQHHLVPKLQEGRQEEIMMGGYSCRFPGTPALLSGSQVRQEEIMNETRARHFPRPPAAPSGSQATRRETRGDYDGRQ